MIRKIIHIDEDKCNGCGICATACHEGAIEMVDGKAKLAREHFCDGFGDCLPACPMGAITFEEREAPAYDEAAVMRAKQSGSTAGSASGRDVKLSNWPVQIKLAPIQTPYFDGADLLIAADCTAYAYAKFHSEFIDGRVTSKNLSSSRYCCMQRSCGTFSIPEYGADTLPQPPKDSPARIHTTLQILLTAIPLPVEPRMIIHILTQIIQQQEIKNNDRSI